MKVPIHEAPIQEAPINEAPSVDGDPGLPGDRLVGVDDHHVAAGEEPDRRPDVIEAPFEESQHITEPAQLVEEGSRPKRSPKPNSK